MWEVLTTSLILGRKRVDEDEDEEESYQENDIVGRI